MNRTATIEAENQSRSQFQVNGAKFGENTENESREAFAAKGSVFTRGPHSSFDSGRETTQLNLQ